MQFSSEDNTLHTGYKVSKVRWKPLPTGTVGKSNTLATGSYEDRENRMALWTLPDEESEDLPSADRLLPTLNCDHPLPAAVADMCFLDQHFLVVCLEDGSVRMLKHVEIAKTLKEVLVWEGLHALPTGQQAPCTAVAVCSDGGGAVGGAMSGVSLVTGGEDGRIAVLRSDDARPQRVIEGADSGTVTSLLCGPQMDVLSTSSTGQLKVWDLRSNSDRPVSYVLIPGEFTSMESVARHPHQPHVLAIGRGDGSVCFKDLRQPKPSLQLLHAHSAQVWEVKFDSLHPNNLFTCSQDGSLWHWDVNDIATRAAATTASQPSRLRHPNSSLLTTPSARFSSSRLASAYQRSHLSATDSFLSKSRWNGTTEASGLESDLTSTVPTSCPWLSDSVQQGKVNIHDYSPGHSISINSLDVESERLVCGTDAETLYLVPPLTLR